jgi:RNA polymerase sigma-70 factor (ECF subfamily)
MEAVSAARLRAERRRLEGARLGDHTDRLFRAALMLGSSPADAERIVRETLARALIGGRGLAGASEATRLMRALRSVWRELPPSEPPEPGEGRDAQLTAAVRRLPERERESVVAVDIVGLTPREAAAALGAAERQLMLRLFRGRRELARGLEGA